MCSLVAGAGGSGGENSTWLCVSVSHNRPENSSASFRACPAYQPSHVPRYEASGDTSPSSDPKGRWKHGEAVGRQQG